MIGRPDREDVSRQKETLLQARVALTVALETLAAEANTAAKRSRRTVPTPDMEQLAADYNAVERAREAVEIAAYDLAGARGEDL